MKQEFFLNKITLEEYDSVKESILEEYTKTLYKIENKHFNTWEAKR